jgi:hypothetical protein
MMQILKWHYYIVGEPGDSIAGQGDYRFAAGIATPAAPRFSDEYDEHHGGGTNELWRRPERDDTTTD